MLQALVCYVSKVPINSLIAFRLVKIMESNSQFKLTKEGGLEKAYGPICTLVDLNLRTIPGTAKHCYRADHGTTLASGTLDGNSQ
jgi:hypothetical protein